ncbi:hypothetical protein LX32DRAFT_646977 [Colletotrichum zoysiae]|uniref:Uncharacterized protein n=1 Tax=Colletotrichum zoysiae TaxID=1216348 RepID=A0AAD9H2H3_9PEZI|nr:hypothetical protein LX32DRAFT_646977 [Colletotrichum zoysiae]
MTPLHQGTTRLITSLHYLICVGYCRGRLWVGFKTVSLNGRSGIAEQFVDSFSLEGSMHLTYVFWAVQLGQGIL